MTVKEIELYSSHVLNLAVSYSKLHCKGGYPDSCSCKWYHCSWPLLRYLGLVSNPFWHLEFFSKELKNVNTALVLGTADFSMPYICNKFGCENVIIFDKCFTPLLLCKDFSERMGLDWKIDSYDLIKGNHPNKYDVIVNDAFLSRFKKREKKQVLKRIHSLLKKNGHYITTIREGIYKTSGYRSSRMKRDNFVKKALERCEHKDLSKDYVSTIAWEYVENMISFPVECEENLFDLFEKSGFEIANFNKHHVEGECEESVYFQVVAKKKD